MLYGASALVTASSHRLPLVGNKREVDSLHGRVALGFLIVQDIVVVLVMIALSAFGVGAAAADGMVTQFVNVLIGGILMLVGVALFIRYGAEPLLHRLAGSDPSPAGQLCQSGGRSPSLRRHGAEK